MAAIEEVETVPATPAPATTVRVLRSVEEVEAERARLEELPWGRVDARPDYFLAVLNARKEAERPHVVLVERGDEVVAALAGRVERAPLEVGIGYTVLYRPVVRSFTMVHGGAIADDPDGARILVTRIEESLAAREFDVASFPALPLDGVLRRALDGVAGALRRGRFADRRPHHRLVLAESLDAWTKTWSSKARYKLKRQCRLFEEAFPGEISVRTLSAPEDYERIFADIEAIAAQSYQRALGAGFADDELYRAIVRVSLDHDWFRAFVVYRGETPIAFWQGYADHGTFHSANMGYDAAYADHSPGTYVLWRGFEELFADAAVTTIDYGLGDAEYKRRFGNDTWEEQDVLLFAPTARAVRINLTRSAILAAADLARRALDRTGATARVKKVWRRRLRSTS
jgi:CelD/BcsL family acetyltransferase involved in cellulose biosynthesis